MYEIALTEFRCTSAHLSFLVIFGLHLRSVLV
jgi:hypothetical protein